MNIHPTLKSPHHVILNLTSRCNLACLHCFGEYGSGKELSLNQWKKIVDDLVENEVFYINISGGEPTRYPYFKEFIDYLGEKKMFFTLTTNGVFSEKTFATIKRNKDHLINVKVSIDGPDADSHGFLRKKAKTTADEIFNTSLNNIKAFNAIGVPLSISTVLHVENIKKLDKFSDLFDIIKVDKWLLSPITFVGRAAKNKERLEYTQELKELIRETLIPLGNKLAKKGISLQLVDFSLTKSHRNFYFICGAAISFCEIHSDGIVSPCALSRIVMDRKVLNFDNITNTPLDKIWHGNAFNQFRKWQDSGCLRCRNLSKCKRCVPQSFLYFNDPIIPPPFCISIGDELNLSNLEGLVALGGYKRWQQR